MGGDLRKYFGARGSKSSEGDAKGVGRKRRENAAGTRESMPSHPRRSEKDRDGSREKKTSVSSRKRLRRDVQEGLEDSDSDFVGGIEQEEEDWDSEIASDRRGKARQQKKESQPSPLKTGDDDEEAPLRGKKKAKFEEADVHEKDEVKKSAGRPAWNQPRSEPPNKGMKPVPTGAPDCLSGKQFVISGVLDSLERDECADLCKRYGAKVVSAVSSKCSHLILGSEAGESKLAKAKQLGIPCIDEDELFKMIRESNPGKNCISTSQKDNPNLESPKEPEPPKPPKLTSARKDVKGESAPRIVGDGQLWVEKYRPRKVSELCGNPGLITDFRRWLSGWKTYRDLEQSAEGARKRKAAPTTGEDMKMRAALLTGPPGIGKTTLAITMCRELGFEPHEFNASDTRNKKAVADLLGELTLNQAMEMYCVVNPQSSKAPLASPEGQVLVMDEVDGMSSGDRGGIQELIKLIRSTRVPIVCIANDDSSQKIRSLQNHCLKLKFRRPTAAQCRKRILDIAQAEGMTIDPQTAERIAEGCRGDLRQTLNCLQAWRSTGTQVTYQNVVDRFKDEGKTVESKSIFDLFRSFFDSRGSSLSDRMDDFFMDADLNPLFVQENYIQCRGVTDLARLARAADSISEGDLASNLVRAHQRWDLMPVQALLSCLVPGSISGFFAARPNFPAWLGKNSSTRKNIRLVRELDMRGKLSLSGNMSSIRLDYIPALQTVTSSPLILREQDGIEDVIATLDAYYLTREDFDTVTDLLVQKPPPIPSKVKTAFTRQFNSLSHPLNAATVTHGKSASRPADTGGEEGSLGGGGDDIVDVGKASTEPEVDEEGESKDEEQSLVVKKSKKSKPTSARRKT
uniref:Replication factor C subunit 1 n=1 Tax=Compsopogon caeruleus TaxID=31354 RepID=A0A7S1XFP5_9RHOD